MNKITSTELSNALNFAQTDARVSQALAIRNNDKKLDCRFIQSAIISAVDDPIERYEIKFGYDFVDKSGRENIGEDVVVTIEKDPKGNLKLLSLRHQGKAK